MKEITKGIIALVVVLAVIGGAYWAYTYKKSYLKEGDFAEIYYIGYFENGTVFASSFNTTVPFNTPFDEKNYNLTPLKIYMGNSIPSKYPEGWSYVSLGNIKGWEIYKIEGLYEALKGMKKGEEKTITLEPVNAFKNKVTNGTIFNSSLVFGFNATFKISNINDENDTVDIEWMPEAGMKFTFPDYPHLLWENCTEVVSYNETTVILRTTPDKLDNLTLYPWWENASVATYNETNIMITTNPPLGNFTAVIYGMEINGSVINITDEKIYLEFYYGGQIFSEEINRTEIFNRTAEFPKVFEEVQKVQVEEELIGNGYSFHELAGEKVIFRLKLINVYKTS
ncbi:MAG: FKBP-type peptidyl-prolyl cis-trans isomerase [Thermoplasmatales archaeon]|nr:FKBP-type peptidyl-prolyl cis-trans isomerase [Thermoplasmatales archaeon]